MASPEAAVKERPRDPDQQGGAQGSDRQRGDKAAAGEASHARENLAGVARDLQQARPATPGEPSGEAAALDRGHILLKNPFASPDKAPGEGEKAPDGKTPESKSKDGKSETLSLADNPYDSTSRSGALEFQKERTELLANINRSFPGDTRTRAQMLSHMKGFEDRATGEGLDQKDVTDSYHALNEMLTMDRGAMSKDERSLAAVSWLNRAQNPGRTDRQEKTSCQSTQLNTEQIKTDPAKSAERLLAIARDGHSRPDGVLDAENLKPDRDSMLAGASNNRHRGYASQVLENDSVNSYWNERGMKYTRGATDRSDPTDTGYRLRSIDTGKVARQNGKEVRSPLMGADAVAEVAQKMGLADDLVQTSASWDPEHTHVQKFGSKDELYESLQGGDKLIAFHSGHHILNGDGVDGGGHLARLSLKDGEGNPVPKGYVYLSNSWGAESDKLVRLDEAYDATLPPDQWTRSNPAGDGGGMVAVSQRRASGDWYDPNIVSQREFANSTRAMQEQSAGGDQVADHKAVDPDKKEDKPKNELLAQREKEERQEKEEQEQQQQQSIRETQRAQLERLVKIDSLQSQLAYARSNSGVPEQLVRELDQTLAGLLTSRVS